jgi:hypothetical protein
MLTISITINTDNANPISDYEMGILRALTGEPSAVHAAPAPKAAPAAPKAPKPEPAAVVPEPAQEPEEDLLGTETATLDDAVARATALVAAGKTSVVKAALAVAGAKRVSELKGATISTFLEALDA